MARPTRRRRVTAEPQQMIALLPVAVQRLRDGGHHARRGRRAPCLLETGVVVDGDPGEHRDLLAAQTGGAATGTRGQPRIDRTQLLASAAQEVGKSPAIDHRPSCSVRGALSRDGRSPDAPGLVPSARDLQAVGHDHHRKHHFSHSSRSSRSTAFGTTTRRLGATGPSVSSPGLGAMSLSGVYGPTDDAESLRVLHAYLDAGGTLLDTADFYGAGHNEMLIGRALRERSREDAVLSVKFGATIAPSGMPVGFDGRPEHVATSLAYSLRRLDVDHVDVYRPARLDPEVPIEETVGAIQEQVDAGYVRHIGLSEVGADTIRRAAAVAPISDLQIEYSLLTREIETNGILDACRELGISVTAYGVLAKGLVAGRSGGSRDMFPPVPGREPRAQPGAARADPGDRRREGRLHGTARDRLGRGPR